MKSEGDPVQMNWIIQFYPTNGLDSALLGTSLTKKYKCIGSNMVNHAQDWSWVKIFFNLPNKHIPSAGVPPVLSARLSDRDCQLGVAGDQWPWAAAGRARSGARSLPRLPSPSPLYWDTPTTDSHTSGTYAGVYLTLLFKTYQFNRSM